MLAVRNVAFVGETWEFKLAGERLYRSASSPVTIPGERRGSKRAAIHADRGAQRRDAPVQISELKAALPDSPVERARPADSAS
jgi:hypothetical protein